MSRKLSANPIPPRAVDPHPGDEGLEVVRLDGLQRVNAGVGAGDHVELRKVEAKPATKVFAPTQNGYAESFNGRMRDELLNETVFLSMAHARVEIAAWVEDYNRERRHSSLGYATAAAFAAELDRQRPSLRPTGSATQAIASTALMRKTTARLQSQLRESWG